MYRVLLPIVLLLPACDESTDSSSVTASGSYNLTTVLAEEDEKERDEDEGGGTYSVYLFDLPEGAVVVSVTACSYADDPTSCRPNDWEFDDDFGRFKVGNESSSFNYVSYLVPE